MVVGREQEQRCSSRGRRVRSRSCGSASTGSSSRLSAYGVSKGLRQVEILRGVSLPRWARQPANDQGPRTAATKQHTLILTDRVAFRATVRGFSAVIALSMPVICSMAFWFVFVRWQAKVILVECLIISRDSLALHIGLANLGSACARRCRCEVPLAALAVLSTRCLCFWLSWLVVWKARAGIEGACRQEV